MKQIKVRSRSLPKITQGIDGKTLVDVESMKGDIIVISNTLQPDVK